jgi:NAD(P)-dependent dehydrogenase (short-subunit alcohol dehydrogenase family)
MSESDKSHSIVFGGTRGIGRAIVKMFSAAGHRVNAIGRRDPDEADRDLSGVSHHVLDLLTGRAVEEVVGQIVRRDGPVTNVVFSQRYRGDGDTWSGELSVGLDATRRVIEYVTKTPDITPPSSIVVIGSVGGEVVLEEQDVGYLVAKAGLVQMVRYFALWAGPGGTRVNLVSPGTTLKDESQHFVLADKHRMAFYENLIPLRRMGHADDVASVVEFLCSPSAGFVTGQNIIVDGGVSVQSQETAAWRATNIDPLPSRTE